VNCTYDTLPSETQKAARKRKFTELEQKYEQLEVAYSTLEKLVKALQSHQPEDAQAIFEELRRGASPQSLVKSIAEGDVLYQLRAVPETKLQFTLPLGQDIPYYLKIPGNVYLEGTTAESLLRTSGGFEPDKETRTLSEEAYPEYYRPYVAARIADSRLNDAKPSIWTRVSTDDELLRNLFRQFFHFEYQWFCCFHKDHFLDAMVSGTTEYCSPLLVNAVLALACVSKTQPSSCHRLLNTRQGCYYKLQDRLEYRNPQSLGFQFLAEAKRLWDLEQDNNTHITTIQASLIINLVLIMQSADKMGMTYTVHAVSMAQRLGLFGPLTDITDDKKRNSHIYTAWCLYFWLK